ncbi:MAG: hypothetical protein QXI60_07435, partial [Thermofilaceae archaeon]
MAVVPPGLTPGTPKERFDYVLLYEKSATNPSGVVDLPPVELETDERAEIVTAEVFWPSGQPEGKLIPYVDGDPFAGGSQVVLRVGHTSNIAPPADYLVFLGGNEPFTYREVFHFGKPRVADAFQNTTLKVKSKIGARIVTDGAVTGTVTVRFWGYKYKTEARLMAAYPFGVVSSPSVIYDPNTGRSIYISSKSVPVSFDTWDRLPGGQKQEKPIINPLIRYAINKNATTPNTPYDFRYETGNVATEDMNMYFDMTPERQRGLVAITHFGIISAANLKGWAINVNGELRPDKDWTPARTDYNPYHFGHVSPFIAVTGLNLWYPLRKLVDPVYIWREIGRVQIIDA